MSKLIVCLAGLVCSMSALASIKAGTPQEAYDQIAARCGDLVCIEKNMALIDREIAMLVNKRMAFIRRAALLRGARRQVPVKPGEKAIESSVEHSEYMGADPGPSSEVFKTIEQQQKKFEKNFYNDAKTK